MAETKALDDVLLKIEQLHKSLQLSEEIFPVINDMGKFIKEIIPLMVEVNTFMKSSSLKIPSASENLNNISKTTELATHEVMDQLDVISAKLEKLRQRLQSEGSSQESLEMIDEISDATSGIVFAFQFQDITTQQLEHVNRILEAIYDRFVSLFESSLRLKSSTFLGNNVIEAIEGELGAEMGEKSKDNFEKRTEDKMRHTGISQDRIDDFFKSQSKS